MSKLVKITLENFMSLPYAEFEFDQQGIISPVGYNDSGKSALRRALEILWFDKYSQTQAKMITDGQTSFTITNIFDDGVVISRSKYASGATHWLMTQNNTPIFDNQLANGSFAATKGVPDAISAYLGVVCDTATGEILNIRRNTNKLLPITTTGGENYQIFNNLCRGERIAYAVKALNNDVNAKNRELSANSSRLIGKQEALASMQVFDEATEQALLKSANELSKKTNRLSDLIAIAQRYNIFAGQEVIDPIPTVDTARLEALYAINKAYTESTKRVIPDIPIVDTARRQLLQSIYTAFKNSQVKIIPDLPVISTDRYTALCELSAMLDIITKAEAEVQKMTDDYNATKAELKAEADRNNWRICKNCGNIVTADDCC